MTFGEKLKGYRVNQGLSQEQLAEKLSVSRQAITKWEADRGMPDINNLVAIARMFEVSVDSLLDDAPENVPVVMKEEITLENYTKTGACRSKYDAVVKEKYKMANVIYPLMRQKKLSKKEMILDLIVQPGVLDVADSLSDMSAYYLVELNNRQLLVNVTKTYIKAEELKEPFEGKKCVIGSNRFKKMPYKL